MKIDTTCCLLAVSALQRAAAFGAAVRACVNMEVEPIEPFTVDWKIGATGDQCMDKKGSPGTMEVSKQGITCRNLGLVSIADGFFGCAWYESWWTLAYTATKASYSGSAQSRWKYWGKQRTVEITNLSPGTQLCGSEALCPTTKIEWSASGYYEDLYFIFQPSRLASSESNSTEVVNLEL